MFSSNTGFSGNTGFSSNTGFSGNAANAGAVPGVGRPFVGRSYRGFVGGGAANRASAGEEARNTSRRAEPIRSVSRAVAGGEVASQSASRQQEGGPGRARTTSIVPRHRVAFEFTARGMSAIGGRLQAQLANLAARNADFLNIRVQVDPEGLVHLQGQVPSDSTRKLAAILVRLEPGVRGVHNDLSVESDRDKPCR